MKINKSSLIDSDYQLSYPGAILEINNSEINNSNFTDWDSGTKVFVDSSSAENTYFHINYGRVEISNSNFSLDTTFDHYLDYHIYAAEVNLTNSSFETHQENKKYSAIKIPEGFKTELNLNIEKCKFYNYKNAIELIQFDSLNLKFNNFHNISKYIIKNNSISEVYAQQNYWGTTDEDTIRLKIYDFNDNSSKGLVHFEDFFSNPRPESPKNVLKRMQENKLLIAWNLNEETNIKGYRIYQREITSGEFNLYEDVGNVDSFLTNLDIIDDIYITAYTYEADGYRDQYYGNESEFSEPAKPFFEVNYPSSTSICNGSTISAVIQENYEFDPDNFYTLQLSSVTDSFANPVILDTISSANDTLVSFLPDTLQFEKHYLVRVISRNLDIHNQPLELIYYDLPSAEFSLVDEACQADTITISYTGQTSDGLTFEWDLDETILVENQGDTLIKIIGGAYEEKTISLTTTKNGCSSTVSKKINIKKTPSATFDVESEICEGETAIVTYTGNGADSAQYIWDFGDATIISGEKSGPYELKWSSFGLKRIGLQVIENGCSFGENSVVFYYSEQPKLAFEGVYSVCYNENYQIEYTGTQEGEITWDFKNATIISGSGAGPYLLKWDTSGEKSIRFSIDNHSCISDTTIKITVTPQPVIPEICLVTVDEETANNMLVWSYDMETVDKFGIYRETNTANEYQLIEFIDGGQFNTYIDGQSVPDQISNRYKITAVDSCGTETEVSDFHKTIHLTINKGLDNSWNLIWDSYEGFTFGTYNIYRSINDGEFELLKEVASNLTSYTDKNVVANSVAYQIEVVNLEGCGEFENGRILQYTSSRSNVARIGAVTGIENTLLENTVSIAPNPTTDFIQINLNKKLSGSYSLTNLAGKEVWKGNFDSNFKIDLREYKSGVYFLNIMTDMGSIVKKILKD